MVITNQRESRPKYHAALSDKSSGAWNDLKAEGLARKLPLEAVLRKKCDGPVSGMPQNILYDFMAREDMLPGSSFTKPAMKVEECIDSPFRANLLFAHWDRLYHDSFWNKADRNGSEPRTYAQTVDELEAGSIYRPYGDTREVINRNRRTPDIALSQVIAGVTTQADDLIRGTGFTVDGSAGNIVVVPERGDFPEVAFTLDQDASGMQKIGISLASSRESKLKESYVQTVDRVVTQIAAMQESVLSVQAIKQIFDARTSTSVVPNVENNIQGIVTAATSAENGYRIDTAIMGLTKFRDWAIALYGRITTTATDRVGPVGADDRVPGLFGPTSILNDLNGGMAIGFLRDTDRTTVGLSATDILGFDRSATLDFYQQMQGMVDEETYMVPTQEWKRVISMIYGQKIFDRNGIKLLQP